MTRLGGTRRHGSSRAESSGHGAEVLCMWARAAQSTDTEEATALMAAAATNAAPMAVAETAPSAAAMTSATETAPRAAAVTSAALMAVAETALMAAAVTMDDVRPDDDIAYPQSDALPDGATFLQQLFGSVPSSGEGMAALVARYPGLDDCVTFADVIDRSRKYLQPDVLGVAAVHARADFSVHGGLDMARVAADTAAARVLGMDGFLRGRSEALRGVTIQPIGPLEDDLQPEAIAVPPRPPPSAMPSILALPHGGAITLPDGFRPNGAPTPCPPAEVYQVAVEYIHKKDHAAGLSVIIPLDEARRLCEQAAITMHSVKSFIVGATDKPEGRLVVHYTDAGINSLEKRDILSTAYGPIVYPCHTDFCRLLGDVRRLFPGEQLIMFKADFDRWFKRIRLVYTQAPLLTMTMFKQGIPYAVIPLVGQFGAQEFNYMATAMSAYIYSEQRNDDIRQYGGPVELCFSDDTGGFLPEALYPAHDQRFTARAERIAGNNAAPQKKKQRGQVLTMLGAQYDLHDMHERAPTIGISEALFLKLICLFFLELRGPISTATSVRPRFLMRMASYMQLAGDFIPALQPYRHGLYDNLRGVPHDKPSLRLKHRSVIDITYWRAALYATVHDPSWLEVPTWVPPLLKPLPDSDRAAWARYQGDTAHLTITTDAATNEQGSPTWGGGWWACVRGGVPVVCWGEYQLPLFSEFLASGALNDDELARCDQINLYEAIVVVLASCAVLERLSELLPERPPHLHIHIWCDNTAAISWLSRYRNHHPLINYILQVFARLQCQHRVVFTLGHIPGAINFLADAISRRFRVVDGSVARSQLSHLTPHQALPHWWGTLITFSRRQSATAWQVALAALTPPARKP